MGYFAVLFKNGGEKFRVQRCHINLWALPGLIPGRRLLYFDVGLDIEAVGSRPVKSVQLLLPFRVEEARWRSGARYALDLWEVAGQSDTAELIFGGPVRQRLSGDERRVESSRLAEPLHFIRIRENEVAPVDKFKQRDDCSLYNVPLGKAIAPGQRRYIRLRWQVFGTQPIWEWKRGGGGARVDLRISDIRESRFASEERSLRPRIAEIDRVNFFLVLPPVLHVIAHSPAFNYLRRLEHEAWIPYLWGTAHFAWKRVLVVYSWRHSSDEETKPISIENPFRIFLEFGRAVPESCAYRMVKAALFIFVVLLAQDHWSLVNSAFETVTHVNVVAVLAFLGAGTLLGGLALFERVRSWTQSRFLKPRMWLRRVERSILALTHPRHS
ncbi:hypothetical protein OG426_53615 [Streptomyces canus]|uniref:hypothetical protein n=1 Tax=Streptomyces canus TaxID=58343 RepID=UPI00225817C6|nr:hypothetical protein [Streptomyces canus]MCX4853900.1 hypothetical protein [Streptomyces canus]WSW40631.1 hypothetical protein OG426_53615 [Streptomyces canus]